MPQQHRLLFSTSLLALLLLSGCNIFPIKLSPTPTETAKSDLLATPAAPQSKPLKTVKKSTTKKTDTPLVGDQEIPTPPMDIWARMRQGYQLDLKQGESRVQQDIRWYSKHAEYLNRVQERATPYLYFIMQEIEKRGMPAEFALLPVVESAFQPFAYSPGRAAGLWQFIPSTGKMYKLKQNWWYDGRRDVVAATHAALDYLTALAKQFDGDWELALAAYNAGGGNVRKAIKRNIKSGKPTNYWSLKLPQETMGYVPRLLAIASIIKAPSTYGITLTPIKNEAYFDSIAIGSQLDLALAADMAGITVEKLYQLNPGFNRWATAPGGPHRLNIPVENATDFKSGITALPTENRLRWTRYKIKSGDNLGVIAKKHGTTVAQLTETNKLKNNSIRAGKYLLIPSASKAASAYTQSAEQRLSKKQNKKGKGTKITHYVRAGDTLWDLSMHYKVGRRSLARWNGIAPGDTLHLGQKLVMWSNTPTVSQNRSTIPTTTPPINTRSSVRYRVRKGDSLARIASKFSVSVASIRRWNQLPGKYLQPGQQVQLYIDVTKQAL